MSKVNDGGEVPEQRLDCYTAVFHFTICLVQRQHPCRSG